MYIAGPLRDLRFSANHNPNAACMDQPAEPERLNKRKRVALACDACRERKIRCDGAKPCRPCEKRGEPAHACLYTVSTTAKHVSEQE